MHTRIQKYEYSTAKDKNRLLNSIIRTSSLLSRQTTNIVITKYTKFLLLKYPSFVLINTLQYIIHII